MTGRGIAAVLLSINAALMLVRAPGEGSGFMLVAGVVLLVGALFSALMSHRRQRENR